MADGDRTFRPDESDPKTFRNALGKFATGVTIVTCNSELGPLGMTANSFSSVSIDPPLVLWSPARASQRCAAFEAAENFAIHVLAESQINYCKVFAKEGDNFDGVQWYKSDAGVPLIENCLARFECKQHAIHVGGDHLIIVGKVITASVRDGSPLVFSKGELGQFTKME